MKTSALTTLCVATALCSTLTQCATAPTPERHLAQAHAGHEQATETTVHFAGKTFLRREVKMIDGTGDSRVTMTEL